MTQNSANASEKTPVALPVPEPDEISAPFWSACSEHRLVIQRCDECGRHRHFPRPACPRCGSLEHTWEEQRGTATLYSWIVAHSPTLPAFTDRLPMAVVLVELDGTDGPIRLVGGLHDAEVSELKVGMPMQIVWDDVTDGVALASWTPMV